MNYATIWWVIAAALVAVELLTGSIYLLMLALGAAAGALAAHAALDLNTQIFIAIAVDVIATGALFWWRKNAPQKQDTANPNLHLDIGETVQVHQWQADGTAQVQYRGAPWTVQIASANSSAPQAGPHRVREVAGNRLIVEEYKDNTHG